MIKGVSQQVIEVSHTDHAYFEKAILFLRPAAAGQDKTRLDAQAGAYVKGLKYRRLPVRSVLGEVLRIAGGMVAGGLLTWLAMSSGLWM